MYVISQELKTAFYNFKPQKAKVSIYGNGPRYVIATLGDNDELGLLADNTQLNDYSIIADVGIAFDESRINIGGLSINKYCATNSEMELGNASCAELTLTLNNANGDIDTSIFENAEIQVEVGIVGIDEWVPMGWFVVDEVRQSQTSITVTCLDRMAYLDKVVDPSKFDFPVGIWRAIGIIAEECNIELSDVFEYPELIVNANYTITGLPDNYTLTYRQMLVWMGQILGGITYFNRKGQLTWVRLDIMQGAPGIRLTTANRFNSTIASDPVVCTGVKIIDGENEYLAGTEGYTLRFANNKLMTHNHQDVADVIWNGTQPPGVFPDYPGIKNVDPWYPFTAETVPMPHVDMLDYLMFVTKDNEELYSFITDWTFTLNENTKMACKGDTATFKRQTISPYNATGGVSVSAGTSIGGGGTRVIRGSRQVTASSQVPSTFSVTCAKADVGDNPIPLLTTTSIYCMPYVASISPYGDNITVVFAVFNPQSTSESVTCYYAIMPSE